MKHKGRVCWLGSIVLLALLVAGCSSSNGASAGGASSTKNMPATTPNQAASSHTSSTGQMQGQPRQSNNPSDSNGSQYLIKTLKVTMAVSDTRKVADELQTWISTADPKSTSAGMSYEQASDTTYNVSMNFSVQASLYPQIQQYLRDFVPPQKGRLLNFNETVQDVSNDYIDTQSRLTNLRGEQTRLLDLLSHAQVLGDILSVEQRLTDVEGQIETTEAHLKDLNGQVTFYTVSITLQPIATIAPQPQSLHAGWSIGQIFHDAFAASLTFAQGLATFLIWLLAFGIYIIPLAIIGWFVMRWRTRSQRVVPPPMSNA